MANPEGIADGNLTFVEGQDASMHPDSIGQGAYYAGVNVTANEGELGPRWGFEKKTLTFPEGGVTQKNLEVKSYENVFLTGKYQGRATYKVGDITYIVTLISGVIFFIDVYQRLVTVVEIEDGSSIDESQDRINMEVADKYLIIHDYPAKPVIIEGLTARRSDLDAYEVPISTNGAYSQNRLFIANEGDEFTAGDPTGSLATPDAPITFEEVQLNNSAYVGQVFALPTGYNRQQISAMSFLPVVDTATGVGPLLISTEEQVFSFGANTPRANWENGQFGSLFIQYPGIASQRAFDFMNSDMIYLGSDGTVRTVSMSRQQQNRWSKLPISEPVKNWMKFWDKDLIKFGAVTVFNNKVFITANPYRTKAKSNDNFNVFDYAHGGFVVLELDNLTSFGETGAPTWAGLWTGVNPMDMVRLKDRMFVFSKDNDRINTLYEVTPDKTYDVDGDCVRQVKSVVYTRDYFVETKLSYKTLDSISLGMERVKGDFKVDIKYKPLHASKFLPWGSFEHYAPWRTDEVPGIDALFGFDGHSFNDLLFGIPPTDVSVGSSYELPNYTKTTQLRLEIEGIQWALNYIRILAQAEPENTTEGAVNAQEAGRYKNTLIPNYQHNDWYTGPFKSCEELIT